jgi:CPA2 family monovalent cation:H+ antiporter-2
MLFKGIVSGFVPMVLGYPLRNSILTGMALAQVGEFSFVLSKFGVEYGLLDNYLYQMFLDISILTMAVTSFSISYSPSVAAKVLKLPIPHQLKCGFARKDVTKMYDKKEKMSSHLIIVGFGFNGKTVAKAANAAGIPYLVIETNPESVREGISKGENIFYGDATQEGVLEQADIDSAKIMIVGISDATATRRVIWLAREMNPNIHIIARTRYLQEMGPLYEQGANEVIPEEFETSVEIFVRLLRRYLVPEDQVKKFIEDARADGYDMFRSISHNPLSYEKMHFDIPDVNIFSLRVPLGADVVGMTLEELSLRQRLGITVLAIRRGLETITNPGGDVRILEGDILVLLGSHEDMKEIGDFFTDLSEKNTKNTEE